MGTYTKHKMTTIAIIALICVAGTFAQEWNQWRGPNHDAISQETGLLKTWPEGGPKQLWKAVGLGQGFSGVSFWGDKIFTMGDKEDGSYLVCIKSANGEPLWSTRVGQAGGNDQRRPGPRCTPATDGTRVIAIGQYGEVLCVDITNGKEIWKKNYKDDFGATTVPRWNFCDSPILDGDRVVFLPGGPKGTVVALNKETGDLLWQTAEITDNASYSSVVATEIEGVPQYIAVTDARVFAVSPKDGSVLWQAARQVRNNIPDPICRDGLVFISSGYNAGCHCFKITKDDSGKFKAEQIYDDKSIANQHGGSILVGDYVYVSIDQGGKLTCLNFKTGKIAWQDSSVGKASLGYADGLLIVRSENGPVALVEATPDGYNEKGRFEQPDRSEYNSWPHPVISNGCLYLRDNDILLCYDLKGSDTGQ